MDVDGLIATAQGELAGGTRFEGRLFGAELSFDDLDFRDAHFRELRLWR